MQVDFFSVLCHQLDLDPKLTGACAGFASGKWRSEQFAKYLLRWLPEFCLSYSERKAIDEVNCLEQVVKAAQLVYDTEKYGRRGEFGELILHALLRETRQTEPAISKIFFKDSANNTVKGFDAVHVLDNGKSLELWLGEVKFYTDITAAIRDVVEELELHFQDDYLQKEFCLIANKLDDAWPGKPRLQRLLHPNTSLDDVVSTIVVPVLLTYESSTTLSYTKSCDAYKKAIEDELVKHHAAFVKKNKTKHVRVELFLLPMASKAALLTELHKRLVAMQDL